MLEITSVHYLKKITNSCVNITNLNNSRTFPRIFVLGLGNPIDMIYHVQPWMIVALLPLAVYFEGKAVSRKFSHSIPDQWYSSFRLSHADRRGFFCRLYTCVTIFECLSNGGHVFPNHWWSCISQASNRIRNNTTLVVPHCKTDAEFRHRYKYEWVLETNNAN